jgi:hypothetical protein
MGDDRHGQLRQPIVRSEPIGRLLEIFEEDFPQSKEITLQEWKRRGWWRKTQEIVASLLQEQA